ncbi:MAG TPA: cupin domain-containing protein [Thermoleophilaceae bacterium]|nr:cupin domain-containing protein [Thermoleophilaceae bacterium]
MPNHVLGPQDGPLIDLAGVGVRFMLSEDQTGGGFSLVEHPLAPRTLGSPVHTHSREDEYSFVLEGRVGVLIGEDTFEASPGELVIKPRSVPHAFWNATDEPARFLEIISPAGFEAYFEEAASLFAPGGPPDMERLGALAARYGLEMDFDSAPRLAADHGLALGPPPAEGQPG